jgi:hypothetical protein
MMTLRATADGPLIFHASIRGLPIYLDQFSLIEIAKGDPARRSRFLAALHGGADLLFSVTNAVELGGPQGKSSDTIREFLDEVGPYWFPVELDTKVVVDRELAGVPAPRSYLSERFAKDFFNFATRPSIYSPGSGKVVLCDASIFKLGAVVDWMQPQRDSLTEGKRDLDAALIVKIAGYRAEYDKDSGWLDAHFPAVDKFKPAMP